MVELKWMFHTTRGQYRQRASSVQVFRKGYPQVAGVDSSILIYDMYAAVCVAIGCVPACVPVDVFYFPFFTRRRKDI